MQKKSTVNHLPAVVPDCPVFGHEKLKKVSLLYFMKVTLIQMTVAMIFSGVSIAFDNHAQEILKRKISLELNDISLMQALSEIEKAAKVKFVYSPARINLEEKVSLEVSRKKLGSLLVELLTPRSIKFNVQEGDDYIVLIESEKVDFSLLVREDPLKAEDILASISGRISDPAGNPIPGANILVKGTTNGTTSDADGKYSLAVTEEDAILIFSFIGFTTQEVAVNGRILIDVVLEEDIRSLEEVVVVGYGEQKKVTTTGAVSSVRGDEMKSSPATNLTNTLGGRIPGLTSITRSGQPGADESTLLIRGMNTLGNNTPLIVVDGIYGRDFGRLNPDDIESITVLKDASAAIYGAQAANGVILVTTKRGKAGATKISVNAGVGNNRPTRLPEMADAATYATMMNELLFYKNESLGRNQQFSEDDITKYRDGSDPWGHPNTDWFAETLNKTAKQSNANISISGGTDALRYYVSGATKFSDAYYKNSANDFRQYNFRSNLDGKITPYMTISVDVAANQEIANNPGYGGGVGGTWRSLLRGIPTRHARYPTGEPGPDLEFGDQPVVTTTSLTGYSKSVWDKLLTNARIVIDVPWVKGLSVQGNVSYDKHVNLSKQFQKPWILYSWDGGADHNLTPAEKGIATAQLRQSTVNRHSKTANLFATYETAINEIHNLKLMMGVERQSGFSDDFTAFRRNYISTAVDQLFAGAADQFMTNNGSASQFRRANYFGRANYDYKQKFLLEGVFRYDGSHIFGAGKRFGFFPGISVGWRLSEEAFFQDNVGLFDELKLRASVGKTGNDRIPEYQYLSSYGFLPEVYTFGINNDQKMTYETRIPNPDVTWETATQRNIGLDASLLDHRLSISVDYFRNLRSRLLIQRNASIPTSSGFSLPRENIGKVSNNGIETVISYADVIGDFKYSVSFNTSYAKNSIDYWDEPPGAPAWQQSTGRPMNTRLYYEAIGIFNDQSDVDAYPHWAGARPGDVIFKDHNNDGKIDGLDRVRSEFNDVPRFTSGMSINMAYKNFDLSILIQGATGAQMYIKPESGILGNYYQEFAGNRWTPENTSASYPRTFDGNTEYWRSQDNTFWLRSSDYVRLKSLEIGYNIGMKKKAGMEAVRIYANGSNLLMLDEAKIVDPESDPNGLGLPYPLQKVLNVGVTLKF